MNKKRKRDSILQTIINDIKSGQLKQAYLLFGEETYLIKQYKDKLKEALCGDGDQMNFHVYEGKEVSVPAMIDQAETLPFLAERRVIFVENSGLFKHGGESLAEYLKSPCETTCFVFVEADIDKRSKLFKSVSTLGRAIEFPMQQEETLKRWVLGLIKKEDKKITSQGLMHFLNKTGSDMENIKSELEKLFCYCLEKEEILEEDIDAVCSTRITNHIFDMINAIAGKKTKVALELYYELLALKEPPMRILFLIARQCNMLLQVKELKRKGYDNKKIGEIVKLPGFVVGKYVAQASKFKISELERAVERCVEAEEAVKTGRMNDVMSVEVLIVSVL